MGTKDQTQLLERLSKENDKEETVRKTKRIQEKELEERARIPGHLVENFCIIEKKAPKRGSVNSDNSEWIKLLEDSSDNPKNK